MLTKSQNTGHHTSVLQGKNSNTVLFLFNAMFRVPGCPCLGQRPALLAGIAPSATVAVGNAGEVKAPRGDGHTLRAEDAANSSGGGGSNSGVLREGAEDGSRQGHHHGRGLDDNGGVLALPDTGLIAAAGQRSRATGLAWLALVTAGHVSGMEVHLGKGAERKQNMGMHEKQPMTESMHMQC